MHYPNIRRAVRPVCYIYTDGWQKHNCRESHLENVLCKKQRSWYNSTATDWRYTSPETRDRRMGSFII